jgi:hypothetical protein
VATILIARDLQDQFLETHAVVVAHLALERLTQNVIKLAANPRYEQGNRI